MNKEKVITKMIETVEIIESSHCKDKFSTDQTIRKNVVKAILDELEKVTADENQEN